tara:strand:- start:659 stop:1588 length:930 start_codon:yes stop_codon:yes gene_type:complete
MSDKGKTKQSATVKVCVIACASMLMGMGAITGYLQVNDLRLSKLPIHPEGNRQVSSIPDLTPSWKQIGRDQVMGAEIVETLGTQNYLSRNYIRTVEDDSIKKQIVLDFHAAYYTGMIDTVPHVPERCFVGGGLQQSESSREIDLPMDTSSWRIDQSVPEEFAGLSRTLYHVRLSNNSKMSDAPGSRVRLPRGIGPDSPFKIRVSEFIDPNGGKLYAGYFFIANGGTKSSANDVRQLAFNLSDDYAYYLKVQITAGNLESFDEFAVYAGELVGDLIGEIMRCVPDWIDVQTGDYPADNPRATLAGGSSDS